MPPRARAESSRGEKARSIWHLQARAAPVEPTRAARYTGLRFTFFQSPDGLPLEYYATPTPEDA